jgi:hypothetical protein
MIWRIVMAWLVTVPLNVVRVPATALVLANRGSQVAILGAMARWS